MICTLTRDDMPLLSQWIKKFQVFRLGIFRLPLLDSNLYVGGRTIHLNRIGATYEHLRCPAGAAPDKAVLILADRGTHYALPFSAPGGGRARGYLLRPLSR